ncbi:universal stress protein E [Thalassotalea insulae]|uniref:Universal stress protein E n=1 Tax=Thalassotalea insulae TaxID=2056778 RepID=A0ABQ6GM12_9GAMM|nr:hypothetical protein [Thalassotalea insulae]GLX77048.1 universal stress protein E [Thalassotalea insulae]
MRNFQNILTLVQSSSDGLVAVKKSLFLAKRNHAQLTVLFVKPKVNYYSKWLMHHEQLTNMTSHVKDIMELANQYGISAMVNIVNDNEVAHAVEQQLEHDSYDLLVAEHNTPHSNFWPFTSHKEEHELIDVSQDAVLFVGSHDWHQHGHILAAVGTDEHSIVHQKFNQKIIEKTDVMAKLLSSDCHFVSCYSKSCQISFEQNKVNSDEYSEHLRHLVELVEPYQLSVDKLHIEEGIVDDVLPHQAQSLNANMVIIGCNEHRGLLADIKGHAIDYVMDKLPCDILALQPNAVH